MTGRAGLCLWSRPICLIGMWLGTKVPKLAASLMLSVASVVKWHDK